MIPGTPKNTPLVISQPSGKSLYENDVGSGISIMVTLGRYNLWKFFKITRYELPYCWCGK